MKILILASLISVQTDTTAPSPTNLNLREWIIREYPVQAEFIGFYKNKVWLREDNGDIYGINPQSLSKRDVRWYKDQLRREWELRNPPNYYVQKIRAQRSISKAQRRRADRAGAYRCLQNDLHTARRNFARFYSRGIK